MKKWQIFVPIFILLFILTACSGGDNEQSNGKIKAVSSFTILEDMIKEIGGDNIEVHNLVPTGTDPHEYDPLPEDIKAVTDAELLFYNGLNLEGGESGWFAKVIEATDQRWDVAFKLSEGIEPLYLETHEELEETNPHAFLDPNNGIIMVENARDALSEIDPDYAEQYKENA